jgi:mannose-1-phosphate guanylyltransferase
LKQFAREYFGTDAPKQFCAFVGRRTMIEQTLRRAETVIPRRRLVVVATAHHRRYVFDAVTARPPGTILIQPVNRETAPGILLPLVHILHRDPRAVVAILPSDHFVLPGRRFMAAVSEAAAYVSGKGSESVVLLGVEPTDADSDYGWIEPKSRPGTQDHISIRPINRFVEKPSDACARELMQKGWLWNTMVLVACAQSLMKLVHETVPELAADFAALRCAIGTPREHTMLNELYRAIPPVNFSSAVLAKRTTDLRVLPVRKVRWSDWGRGDRILQTLTDIGLPWPVPARHTGDRQGISAWPRQEQPEGI